MPLFTEAFCGGVLITRQHVLTAGHATSQIAIVGHATSQIVFSSLFSLNSKAKNKAFILHLKYQISTFTLFSFLTFCILTLKGRLRRSNSSKTTDLSYMRLKRFLLDYRKPIIRSTVSFYCLFSFV
jgi:hypothetical protein